MELHWSSLFLGLCILFHITVGQDFSDEHHISMCSADSERTDEITVVGDSPHYRISTECTCKVSTQGDPAGPSDFNVRVRDFKCTRKCEWRLQVYVNGCKRFDVCCDTTWSSEPMYLLRSHEFTPQTEVYVTHKNVINDHNGSWLDVMIFAVPLNNSIRPYTEFTTQCGYSFSDIQMQNSTQCASTTTTTTTPSSSSSTAVPPATISNNTEAPSVTDGNPNENSNLFSGWPLIAVIVGCVAAFIVILISVIAIAVCLHKRKGISSAASTTTSQRKIGDWLNDQQSEATGSVYSYSRNLPANNVPAPRSVPDSSERRYQPCFDPPPNDLYYKYADSYHA